MLTALPAKTREFVEVPLTSSALSEIVKLQAEEAHLRQLQRAATSQAEAADIGNRIRGVQMKCYSATGCGKLPAVIAQVLRAVYTLREDLRPCIDGGGPHSAGSKRPREVAPLAAAAPPTCRKLLVFAHHTEVIAALESALLTHSPPIRCVRSVSLLAVNSTSSSAQCIVSPVESTGRRRQRKSRPARTVRV